MGYHRRFILLSLLYVCCDSGLTGHRQANFSLKIKAWSSLLYLYYGNLGVFFQFCQCNQGRQLSITLFPVDQKLL
jgi:hypothetical protein